MLGVLLGPGKRTVTNLIRAQRYLQFSAAWPLEDGQARMVPIDFVHAPTPEELRQDESVPWQEVEAFASGKRHKFRIETLGPVLWRKAGAKLPLRLVVIAPIGYRLRKGSKVLYRQLPSTGELLRLLRIELWAGAIRPDSFYDFVTHSPPDMNAEKLNPSLASMLFDAA